MRSSHSLAKAEIVIEAWRRRYDAVRPRSALGYWPARARGRRVVGDGLAAVTSGR